MNTQKQSLKEGAVALQGGRDIVVNQGMNPEDMRQILGVLAAQLPTYTALAREIVDARLVDFERRILEKFTDEKQANPEAFKDPDFQYLLTRAQHAYARSGEEVIHGTLVDLIARRSKENQRSRLSLTLNEAVEKTALLTNNEFAELSLSYILRYSMNNGIGTIKDFAAYIATNVLPLVPDISRSVTSYQYIEALSCGNIEVGEVNLIGLFRTRYGGIFSRGFDKDTLESHLPEEKRSAFESANMVIPCLNDPQKLQLKALNKEHFLQQPFPPSLSEAELTNVWNMFDSTIWNGEDFLNNVEEHLPTIKTLYNLWQETPLKSLKLTTLGLAIGHANLVRVVNLDADISIWIK